MVHRAADSRLLTNLLQQEKEYTKQLNQVLDTSNVSLASFAAYAAASPPPASNVIMAVTASLASADEALRRYAQGVEEWRDSMRMLKDAEDEVGNIMRDREILVTRMIKASKSHKSGTSTFRDSLLLGNQRFPSSSSLSLSFNANQDSPSPPPSRPLSAAFSSSKLAAAQTELQACEAHLAAKERELDAKRCAAVRDGMGARVKAMMECGSAWSQHGKEALRVLDELRVENMEHHKAAFMHEPYMDDACFNTLQIQQVDSTRPSSDFSSIGPSQSASQVNVNHESIPPPVHMGSIMNSGLFGDPPRSNDANPNSVNHESKLHNQDKPQSGPRPPSGASTTASSISAIPATYKVEAITYAPAVAVHVSGRDVSATATPSNSHLPILSELFKDDNSLHTSMRIPPPHALEGYAFDIPTAERPAQQHQRNGSGTPVSGRSTPQPSSSDGHQHVSSYTKRTVLERRITEEELRQSLEERRSANGDASSTEEEVKTEKKLVQEGKLAVVENPRFMTEARRKELEKEQERKEVERQKAMKMEEEKRAKEKAKLEEADEEAAEHKRKDKKRFLFFHSPSNAQNSRLPSTPAHHEAQTEPHVTFSAQLNTDERQPNTPTSSPGKKTFLGSIKGFFGSRQSSELGQPSSSPSKARRVDVEDLDSDNEEERSPHSKSGGLQGLFRGNISKEKEKQKSSTKWETRTDKNIRQLARSGSFDDGSMSRPGGGGLGGGLAGRVVANAGVVNATEVGVNRASSRGGASPRGRAASDVGHGSSAPSNLGVSGRRLKKTRAGPPISQSALAAGGQNVGSTESLPVSATIGKKPMRAVSTSAAIKDKGTVVTGTSRRSASVDVGEKRKSWVDDAEDEGASSGGGMIVDLGRRRKRYSSDVGASAPAPAAASGRSGATTNGVGHSRAASASTPSRQTDAVRPSVLKPTTKGYSSDTPVVASAPAITRKKSLTKKKPQSSVSAAVPPPVPDVPASLPLSAPLKSANASTSTLTPSSISKTSPKSSAKQTTTSAKTPNIGSGSGTATYLVANSDKPSGTLVAEPGWNTYASPVGGGLSRNSSIKSSASAPSGPSGKAKRQTTLGQGMGSTGGIGRRSSLAGSSPSSGKPDAHNPVSQSGKGASVVQAAPPSTNLMSIVEDVARTNREGWKQDSNMKKSVGGSQKAAGMLEVVKAPPPVGRDVLNAMDAVPTKPRATGGSTTTTSSTSNAGPKAAMFEIRAPGSVFDQKPQAGGGTSRNVASSAPSLAGNRIRPTETSTPKSEQAQTRVTASKASDSDHGHGQAPLRSAMRNPSRSPSPPPVAGPSSTRNHQLNPSNTLPPVASSGARNTEQQPPTLVGTSQGAKSSKGKGKAKVSGPPPTGDLDDGGNTTDSESYETGNEYYSDEEAVEKVAVVPPPIVVSQTPLVANGHPAGYEDTKKAESDISHSTTSTVLVGSSRQIQSQTSLLHPGIINTGSASQTPRRRKSVRVSLQPTFSPSPPAMDYDYEGEKTRYAPWGGREVDRMEEKAARQVLVAPVPVRAPTTRQKLDAHDMWQDSGSDEDEEYSKAKRLLTRAAKREKDVHLLVANRA